MKNLTNFEMNAVAGGALVYEATAADAKDFHFTNCDPIAGVAKKTTTNGKDAYTILWQFVADKDTNGAAVAKDDDSLKEAMRKFLDTNFGTDLVTVYDSQCS